MEWNVAAWEVQRLAKKIDYKPDLIIGLARGGIVPALILSHELKVPNMSIIKMERKGNERKILADVVADVKNKHLLLVEDMLETGKSILVGKHYFESLGAKVKTACLYIMPHTEIKPDYFLGTVTEVAKFPWENGDDV